LAHVDEFVLSYRGELPSENLIQQEGGEHSIFSANQNSSEIWQNSFLCDHHTKVLRTRNNCTI